MVYEVTYYSVLAQKCTQPGSPGFIEQRWIRTVNLSSSQTRWLYSFRVCWYFCFLSTRQHHPFKVQAELSQNLSNISSFSLVNSNKSIFPYVLVQEESSIKLLLRSWACAVIADPTPLQHLRSFQIQKPFIVGLRKSLWKFASAQVKFKSIE